MNKKENLDNMYDNYFQHEKRRIEKREQRKSQRNASRGYDRGIMKHSILTRILAEAFGSFILVLATIFAFSLLSVLSFNLSLDFGAIAIVVAVAFAIAYYLTCDVSGGFINPLITIAMTFLRKISIKDAILYICGEFFGAVAACLVALNVLPSITEYNVTPQTWLTYAANGFGDHQPLNLITNTFYGAAYPMSSSMVPAIIMEVLCSAIFVAVIIKIYNERISRIAKGLFSGLTLALLTSLAIQISSAGLNPIKSLTVGLFAQDWSAGSGAFSQVWVFIIFPIIGALLAVLFHFAFSTKSSKKEYYAPKVASSSAPKRTNGRAKTTRRK